MSLFPLFSSQFVLHAICPLTKPSELTFAKPSIMCLPTVERTILTHPRADDREQSTFISPEKRLASTLGRECAGMEPAPPSLPNGGCHASYSSPHNSPVYGHWCACTRTSCHDHVRLGTTVWAAFQSGRLGGSAAIWAVFQPPVRLCTS